MESEEDLEDEIKHSILEHRQSIKTLCYELCVKFDEKYASNQTMMDEEKMLRDKLKQLQIDKNKRVDEFKLISKQENELCTLLDMKRMDIKSVVPTETEMNALKSHIKELEKTKVFNDFCFCMSSL